MLGIIWYRTKVLHICKTEFNYSIATPGSQQELFNRATRGAFENKLNEYDGAIAVMLAVVRTLISPTRGKAEDFYVGTLFKIIQIIPKSKIGRHFLEIHVMEYPEHFCDEFLEKWPQLKFIELFFLRPKHINNSAEIETIVEKESDKFSKIENFDKKEQFNNLENNNKLTKEQRLVELRDFWEKKLINEKEYSDAKREILRS